MVADIAHLHHSQQQIDQLQAAFQRQRSAFAGNPLPSLEQRRQWLKALLELLRSEQQALIDAISADFSNRSADETLLAEIMPSLHGIHYASRRLGKWMKPSRRQVGLAFQPASARVLYQPLGVVGVIVPWNYPLYLAIGPLVGALAAGNRVMIKMSESTTVFHYAQEIFEGMKAYRTADGKIQLFRPDCNANRFNDSADRLGMPPIPPEDFVQAVKALVDVDRDWVPHSDGASLYIRPFCIATDVGLGVHAAKHYRFAIICAPSGAYYAEGLDPVRIYVEDEYIRAAPGLTGFTKCGGNYAASIKAGELAEERGFSQVLWLDGVEKKYVEEVGSMNIMFKIDGEIYTAPCVGTVLPGVTRRSIIELLKDWGYKVHEERVAIADIMKAADEGKLEEVFGTGTAAVVSPVKELDWEGKVAHISGGHIGELTQKLYDTLTGIQWGKLPDTKGWIVPVE